MGILRSLLPALLLSPLALQAQLPTTPVTGDVSVHVEQVMQSAFGQRYMGTVATANNSNLKPGDRVMLATVGQGGLQIAMAPIGGRMMAHTTSASAVTSGTPQVGSVLCFSSAGSCAAGGTAGMGKAPSAKAAPAPASAPAQTTGPAKHQVTIEGIGIGMSLDEVRAAAKADGSVKGPVKQGPVTYNLDLKDIGFQLEFSPDMHVTSYNVSMNHSKQVKDTETSGPLHDKLVKAFGDSSTWGSAVMYDIGETGVAYAIVRDPSAQ